MRASEIITIYLAAGAPFGVNYALHQKLERNRAHLFLKALGSVLFWPLIAGGVFLTPLRKGLRPAGENGGGAIQPHEEKLNRARRDLISALFDLENAAQFISGTERETLERSSYVARESIERYVGLADAVAGISPGGMPDKRDLEIFRLAGRKGDDLLLAGRCVRRRNAARLLEHMRRARTELLHALAEVCEVAGQFRPAPDANGQRATRPFEGVLKLYSHAIEFFSLMEDSDAARLVGRLLEKECSRLRRLTPETSEEMTDNGDIGETPCTTHTARPSLASLAQPTTLTQG